MIKDKLKKVIFDAILIVSIFFSSDSMLSADNDIKAAPIKMKIGYIKDKDNSVPPELFYSEISNSLTEDFIRLYNENNIKELYGKTDITLKKTVTYRDFQKAIDDLRLIFGNILHFQRITREEQLASPLISMLSEEGRKTSDGEVCNFYLYRIKCEKLCRDGMLELVYTKENKLIDFYMRSEFGDIADKIESVEPISE